MTWPAYTGIQRNWKKNHLVYTKQTHMCLGSFSENRLEYLHLWPETEPIDCFICPLVLKSMHLKPELLSLTIKQIPQTYLKYLNCINDLKPLIVSVQISHS